MDTMNIPHVDNAVGTPPCPSSQCSKPDEDIKRAYSVSPSAAVSTIASSSTARSPSATASPPPSCAICLGAFVNKCMPDICMHQFCFNCLLQWSKVKAVCPLCKQQFLSIIHNVRSNFEYDEHVIERPPDQEYYLPNAPQPRHFQFRTTFTVDPRGELAIQQMLSSHPLTFPIGVGVFEPFTNRIHRHSERTARVSRADRRNYMSSTAYRRSIYEQGLWVVANPDGADMHREATPEFYRNNEGAITRLVPWLNRELTVLMQHANTEQVANLIDQILAALRRHHILSRHMWREVLQPYLQEDSEHFAHEFYNYMRSPLDMIGYDRSCVHGPRVIENVVLDDQTSDDSNSSTVLLLDQTQSVTSTASTNDGYRFPLFMPAPLPAPISNDVIEIPDSDGADSDVILQTPPPPTIVDLLNDTSDSSDVDICSRKALASPRLETQSHRSRSELNFSIADEPVEPFNDGPSTSRGTRRRRVGHTNRCHRHDQYVVDRKTVLPLKIRLKRKRNQPSKCSGSKSRQCCKNGGAGGYSSSSSNDTSLQSRLQRRRKFHKKKYYSYMKLDTASDSSSPSSSTTGDDKKRPPKREASNSFASSDDDEPLSTIRKGTKRIASPSDNGQAGSSGSNKVKTKRELRDEREQKNGDGGSTSKRNAMVPPGVFEPSVPSPYRSPVLSSTASSPSTHSQSSRYTPDLVSSTAHLSHFNHLATHFSSQEDFHQPPPPTRSNSQQLLTYFSNQQQQRQYQQQDYRADYETGTAVPSSQSHTPPLSLWPFGPHAPSPAELMRREEYFRSLVPPLGLVPAVAGPSTSSNHFPVDRLAMESLRYLPPQQQAAQHAIAHHRDLGDPMWNGIRPEHVRDEDASVMSLRSCL